MKPALAIPFFTGVVAFVGNIILLTKSIQKWQDSIVNKVLHELDPVLNRIKPGLIDALATIIDQIDAADIQTNKSREQSSAVTQIIEPSPLACMSNVALLREVQKKLKILKASVENNDVAGVEPNSSEATDSHHQSTISKSCCCCCCCKQGSEAQASFRKLNESEMVLLLRNLWTSIRFTLSSRFQSSYTFIADNIFLREELGLSARNVIIALVTSSLLLGLFLLFIFIGIGIFSKGDDNFAAIINAGLTLSAGAGIFRFDSAALCLCR